MTAFVTGRAHPSVTDMIDRISHLGATKQAVAQVMRLAGDHDSTPAQVAAAVNSDPGLTCRLLRTANSSYYGLAGRVSSTAFAVALLGHDTVHDLAATTATEGSDGLTMPPWFRVTATSTASAAELIAPLMRARADDAFCVGMFAEIGVALFEQQDPPTYASILASATRQGITPLGGERAVFGIDHAQLAGRVLTAWQFPDRVVAAVLSHHDQTHHVESQHVESQHDESQHDESQHDQPTGLGRTVRAARVAAAHLAGFHSHDPADQATALDPEVRAACRLPDDREGPIP